MCYLLHFSTAVLYLIDYCTALHNCSNARVRYKITCWYSNRKKLFLPIRIPTSYFVSNSRIRTIMQCSAVVDEIPHSHGEVQQKKIAHKGSIQINDFKIINLFSYLSAWASCAVPYKQFILKKTITFCTIDMEVFRSFSAYAGTKCIYIAKVISSKIFKLAKL